MALPAAFVVVDNRNAEEMYGYLEARIETLKRRIKELEGQNEILRRRIESECISPLLDKSA